MKISQNFSATGLSALATEYAWLAAEAQIVIAMRMMGMAGFWNTTDSENRRMVDEKPKALMRSGWAMWGAAISGQPPEKILQAGLAPLRRRTRSNVRRLSRRGPSLPILKH